MTTTPVGSGAVPPTVTKAGCRLDYFQKKDRWAIVLRDYSARELAVQPGDEVEIEEVRHGWALVRNAQGDRGWIPKSHIVM